MTPEPIRVLLAVVEVFDQLGIDYVLGGSMASSVFGEPRSTADIDLLARLDSSSLEALLSAVIDLDYLSETAGAVGVGDLARRACAESGLAR